MPFTRKEVSAILEDESLSNSEKLSKLITMHSDVTNALKDERDDLKHKAEKSESIQKQLDDANNELDELKKDDSKEKLTKLSKEFEDYKANITAKETKSSKDSALSTKLKAEGFSQKGIDKILKYGNYHEKIELDEKGEIKNYEDLKIADEWSEYKGVSNNNPAPNPNPPIDNKGGNNKPQSRAAQIVARYHDSLYGSTPNKEV